MDPERDDYADLDRPPSHWTAERIVVRLLQIIFVVLMGMPVAMLLWVAIYP